MLKVDPVGENSIYLITLSSFTSLHGWQTDPCSSNEFIEHVNNKTYRAELSDPYLCCYTDSSFTNQKAVCGDSGYMLLELIKMIQSIIP